ncbi:penicillin-binding protein 1C [Orbus hercynius]|uniref:peptidoglycan glycosyltransferase n=1 Tax=Orbus hercynius TaxID=593135 RepID=A0A495RJ75_9GAMM|nr:penicillin-binding protein 1C [Orbus hercynius]RKS86848.1 penicillin-binding protein 1C [Orbus hercynius]
MKLKKLLFAAVTLPALFFVAFIIADALLPLPMTELKPTQTILAQNGVPMWRFADSNGIWRYPITLDDVPDYYLQALLTYEDRHFYQHAGIDFLAILRAAYQNITNRKIVSGGSTISMQVARIIDPHQRTIIGKFRQLFRALQLEWHYSKAEILTLYINRAPYGGMIEGIGAASWSYLGKAPSELTRSEAALFAVIPQAPSRLRPDRYPDKAQKARDKVLARLQTYQVWSAEVIAQVKQEEVWIYPRKTPRLAPLLSRRLSQSYPAKSIIRSTIDEPLQYALEDMALNWKNQLLPKSSLAILVVDHTDMTVKGYVGSVDFRDASRLGQVDMIKSYRSPGSTLKPFLYGLALNDGMIHSESLLQDVPRISSQYRPKNFDTDYHGPVSVSDALQRSLNLPAVQLMELYGATRFTSQLNSIGLELSSLENQPNISYILGGVSVRMDQLVSAYGAFARQGNVAPLRFTLDEPLLDKRLINKGSAWVIRQILALQPVPMLKQSNNPIVPLAWKTGTSYGYRDAWAIGINPRYLIGIWVGRPDGTPVVGQYGTLSAVPILQQVNSILLNKQRSLNRDLPTDPKPESVRVANICWPTGQELDSSDENCHRQKRAWIVNDMIPPTLEQLHMLKNNLYRSGTITIWINKRGLRVNADCVGATKKEIALWPIELEGWILAKETRQTLIPPTDLSCPALGDNQSFPLLITGIRANEVLRALPNQAQITMTLNSQGGNGTRWWFLDGNLMTETISNTAFTVTLNVNDKGRHDLLLLDESGQIDRIYFHIQ